MALVEAELELTPKRIARILRRVRVSCKALQQYHAKPQHTATYASSSTAVAEAPLSIIPPPNALKSRTLFEQSSGSKLELSPKLYAVRDAFRDLVLNTARSAETGLSSSLTALCAIVIGGNIEQSAEDEEALDNENDNEALLYEAIPGQYRRWALLSHATSTILTLCPPHPTLYRILLDVAIQHELRFESETFLRSLLDLSFAPTNHQPYICHPVHSRYLLDLRATWLSARNFTDCSFLRILCDSLADAHSPHVWLSRAVELVLHNVAKTHSHFVFDISYALFECISHAQNPPLVAQLGDKYATWISAVIMPRVPSLDSEVYDLTRHFYELGIQRMPTQLNLTGSITCLLSLVLGQNSHPWALSYLRQTEPQPITYNALVEHVFRTSTSTFEEKSRFAEVAACLSDNGLLRLEAALWRCILDHIDTLFTHDRSELREYREELADLLEDAEQRCFGSEGGDGYRWDPIGCWVRVEETPRPRKRQKRSVDMDSPKLAKTKSYPRSPFVSLLRRAASKRVVLHPVPLNLPSSSPRSECSSPVRFSDVLSSDDALDMFAYPF
ncbi:hypothetical protein BDZ89DRAFT_1061331 [Hymenopellis radicata]|nr:hypothetical protein BDZ89DRAFT_1061331 [Hymenopellis radicata]